MRRTRMLLRILLACLLAGALFWCALATAVFVKEGAAAQPTRSDCAIVLGARVMPSGQLSTALLRRVEKALSLYTKGLADTLVVCGAQGGDEPQTEASAMRDWLVAHGVPEEAIVMDEESTSTEENLRNAKKLMEARGLSSAIVVTNAYHLTRAMWIAADEGLSAQGAAAANNDLWQTRMRLRFREAISWTMYFLGI